MFTNYRGGVPDLSGWLAKAGFSAIHEVCKEVCLYILCCSHARL